MVGNERYIDTFGPFAVGRTRGGVDVCKDEFALPVKRLIETERVIAFEHPTPAWAVHILIVPKRVIEGVERLDEWDSTLLGEVFSTVQRLVDKMELKQYRVIVNGGEYQEVKQLHFHLVAGEAIS
jgi:histidine triad (HIT) family protein